MVKHYIVKNGKVVGISYLNGIVDIPEHVISDQEADLGDLYDPVTKLFSKPEEVTDV